MNYQRSLLKNLFAFIASRLIPYLSIMFVLMFQAQQNFAELALLAYVLATYAVPVSLLSMLLAVVGNLVALNREDLARNQQLFKSGLAVALGLAGVTFLVCFAVHAYWMNALHAPGVDMEKLKVLSSIYLLSAPLVVINNFLFFFNEAYVRAASCTKIKLAATLSALLITFTAFELFTNMPFLYFAGVFFVLLECISLVLFVRLSMRRSFEFRPQFSWLIAKDVLTLGIPVALGLGVQKIYFLLFTDRLLRMGDDRVSLLSVSMSIVGLLMIPIAAFSQFHSLYIGKHSQALPTHNLLGTFYLCALSAVSAGAFFGFKESFFRLFGRDLSAIPSDLPLAVICLFLASAAINFSMGQLRAFKDTLIPQAIAGAVLLVALYPVIASNLFDEADLSSFLYAEAAALFGCYLLLQCRTFQLGRRRAKASRLKPLLQ